MIEVKLDDNTIDQYDEILSNFPNWKETYRKIKLMGLLNDNKKLEFEINIDNSNFFVSFGDNSPTTLLNASAILTKLIFIIDINKVVDLKIECSPISTIGNSLKDYIEQGIEIIAKQKYRNGNIRGFDLIPSI